jgi:hypothetical protein
MNLPMWGWIAVAAGAAAAVGGIAYAASGGAATAASGSASTGGTNTNPTGTTQPAQAAGMTVAGNAAIITASQNALMIVAASNKVPMLNYSGPANGNATDPTFVAALQVFQHWQNQQGGFTAPGSSKAVQLNTNGVLDFDTVAAVLTAASQ